MIILTDKSRRELTKLQRSRRTHKTVYVKVTVLLMLDQGFKAYDVARALGIDSSTVFRYQKSFIDCGEDIDVFVSNAYQAYTGKLSKLEEDVLSDELDCRLYTSSAAVVDFIKQAFHKSYSVSGVNKLLRRLGFTYKKTTSVPARAEKEAQLAFLATFFELLRALKGNEVLYFNDAMHPVHNTRPDCGWIRKGNSWPVPANSGRRRLNLNGAMNANDPIDVIIQTSERVNAQSSIKLWKALRRRHPGKTIYNIVDNARYYHCKVTQDFLTHNTWCKVIYLPPYSPNLNLIERLWKYLRKKVINLHYYQHFAEFEAAILHFFKNIKKHKAALESLMQPNFQVLAMS